MERDAATVRSAATATVAAVLLLLAACVSAPAGEDQRATIDHPGAHLTRYRDTWVEAVVDSEYAARSVGEPWMILNFAITGRRSASQEIRASAVRLVTPDGRTIPLPPYDEFTRRYPEYRAAAERARITADPLGVFQAGRQWLPLDFHPMPGGDTPRMSAVSVGRPLANAQRAAMTSVWVNNRKIYWGPLYFPVDGGVTPGRYVLEIELKNGTVVRLPFDVG